MDKPSHVLDPRQMTGGYVTVGRVGIAVHVGQSGMSGGNVSNGNGYKMGARNHWAKKFICDVCNVDLRGTCAPTPQMTRIVGRVDPGSLAVFTGDDVIPR